MKILAKKMLCFILMLAILLAGLDWLSAREGYREFFADLTDSREYIQGNVGSDEIIPYIRKAQEEDGTRWLVLGDSVCHQMFRMLQTANPDASIIGSNGAITMAGQYILAKEYFDHHEQVTDLFLLVLPESLQRTFDTKWGYQYTVMPFVETDTLRDLDERTIETMAGVYGRIFMRPTVVRAVDRSAINRKLYLNLLQQYGTGYQQETPFALAEEYIKKIDELCAANDCTLHLYACPVSESKRQETAELTEAYRQTWLGEAFPSYLDDIWYFPDEQARDYTHFSGDFANQEHFNEVILEAYAGTKLLAMLHLDEEA